METTFRSGVYLSELTPITNMGASAEGAEMTTFFAPALMCFDAPSRDVNTPVDSTTKSTPRSPHGIISGSRSANTETSLPSTKNFSSSHAADPENLPCTVSYLNMYAM